MKLNTGSLSLGLICASLLFSAGLWGQATGTISGLVSDATGSAVSGAKITVTAPATGVSREAISDSSGHYVVPLLGVGNYNVRAEITGFRPEESLNIILQTNEQRELDFTLAPATLQQNVEVNATAVAVQTSNGTLGQVITSQQVADLPLNGRDFVQLATLTPGTTQETNPNSFFNGGASSEASARGSFSLSVGGSRANSTDWILDGNDNNELTSGAISILSSIDSIQEFKVLTYNYSAEYGTRGGPTVLVTTKSGSNQFHGTIFEFFRNTDLDARSFFAAETEKFNLNQFGFSAGGPIRKNKTFFFADFEQKDQRHGIPFTGVIPSIAMRNGNFTDDAFGNPSAVQLINPYATRGTDANPISVPFMCIGGKASPTAPNGSQAPGAPCNIIPQSLINPIGQALINLYPVPNANNAGLGYNYVSEPVRKLNEGKFDIRLDENLSDKDSLFARFSYDQATSYVPGGAPGFAEQGPFASNQSIINHARNVVISETHIFSPTTVNQLTFGFNRIFDYITSQGNNTYLSQKLGIPGANLGGNSNGLTSVELSSPYWSLGDRGYSPFVGGTNVWTTSDFLDLVRGNHDIRIGGSIRANQLNTVAVGFPNGFWIVGGAWTGEPEADVLTGLVSGAIHDQEFGGGNTGRRWKLYRPYIEDNWRIGKSLTVNLGLAWALLTPQSEVGNRMSDFNPATGTFLIAGQNVGPSAGVQMDLTALEPRVGVAWKPFKSNTVFRGGYAIYHDSSWNMGAQGLWQNPPYYAESDSFQFGGCTFSYAACGQNGLTPTGLSMSSGFPTFTAPPNPASFTGTILSQDTNFKQGRIQQFNFNVEQEIPGQVVLTVGYAGARTAHILEFGNDINVSSPSACGVVKGYTLGCGPNGAAFGVPYPAFPFSDIASVFDAGLAHYDSLQVKAETKSTKYGLYALIGYTYSRATDTGFSDGLGSIIGATYFPLPGWQNLDWGLSQINLNHNFTASLIYSLPFGKGRKFGSNWNAATNAVLGGWEATVIEKATSGFPIFVVDSNNTSGAGFENTNDQSLIRPNQICNAVLSNPTLSNWFNASCFAQPAAGELGNANRTPLSGPDFVNTDFSVTKHFIIRESMRLDFRSEFFNLFNHAQFGAPGGNGYGADLTAGSEFNVVNYTVNNPRVIQFALKLAF
ncbi:MAG TPA: carboxypeptidase-like regulatory domain-containing protein [Bryobacteraceae bacterium]|nr:carboxypeptidase-like regulatory domain-containing protein [Bryobacteraceae bacterium]